MKVLILSVPTGGGHLQTSKALYNYLTQQESTECKILDIIENTNDKAAQILSEGYLFTSMHMSTGYRMVYNKMDKRTKKSFTAASKMLYKICKKLNCLCNDLYDSTEILKNDLCKSVEIVNAKELAEYFCNTIIPDMDVVRRYADELEVVMPAKTWPYPVYSELMFNI